MRTISLVTTAYDKLSDTFNVTITPAEFDRKDWVDFDDFSLPGILVAGFYGRGDVDEADLIGFEFTMQIP